MQMSLINYLIMLPCFCLHHCQRGETKGLHIAADLIVGEMKGCMLCSSNGT